MKDTYDYSFVKSLRIDINDFFVIRGLQLNLITKKFAEDYAVSYLEENDTPNEGIVQLAWGSDSEAHAIDLLLATLKEQSSMVKYNSLPTPLEPDQFDSEMWKWRYVLLEEAASSYKTKHELFVNIDIIYKDFRLPNDMSELIYYHPPKKEIAGTPEEAQEELENDILEFIKNQKKLFLGIN